MKKTLAALLAALTLSVLAGCSRSAEPAPTLPPMTAKPFTDREAVYSMYNQVSLEDTLADLEAKFGPGVTHEMEEGNQYVEFVKDGYGVAVALRLDDTVMGKVLYHEDLRQLVTLTPDTDMSLGPLIQKSMELVYVEALVGGPGVELATTAAEDVAGNVTVTRLIVWVDESAANLRVTVDEEDKVLEVQTVLVSPVAEEEM